MTDIDLVRTYINEEDFKFLKENLLDQSYQHFCQKILDKGIVKYRKFLTSLKDTIILKRFFVEIEKANLKNQDYLSVFEIVLFISMIEGYMSDGKYVSLETFIRKNFSEGIVEKDLIRLLTTYKEIYSLSAKVRNFFTKGPFLDQVFLASCIEEDKEIRGSKSSLGLLYVILKKQLFYEKKFLYRRSLSRVEVLDQLLKYAKSRNMKKIPLKEIHLHFKAIRPEGSLLKSIKAIANQLYDIRSKFLHTDNKKKPYSFFLNLDKGNIFDFSDIDFFKYFIRTLLIDNDFEINVITLPSGKSESRRVIK